MQDDRDAEIAHLKSALAAAEQRESVAAERAVRAEIERDSALEQQTATAEVLRVIASSPTQLDTVLKTIVRSAARLCESDEVQIHLVQGDAFVIKGDIGPLA